jgi:hypothetical protein
LLHRVVAKKEKLQLLAWSDQMMWHLLCAVQSVVLIHIYSAIPDFEKNLISLDLTFTIGGPHMQVFAIYCCIFTAHAVWYSPTSSMIM